MTNKLEIEFNRTGYDPEIDYIKGLCILFVVWTHCFVREELSMILFPFWGDTAVPIFLIIQTFHCYKKESVSHLPSLSKLWKRILMPYLILLAVTFLLDYFIYYNETDGAFDLQLYWDKRGPGSYYIFIYIQFAFILPIIEPLFRKIPLKVLLILFILASQVVEYVCSVTDCPDNIYRITFFRYIFLIFLGYVLAKKGLTINKQTVPVIICSIAFIYLFSYTKTDLRPLFCTNLDFWPLCHWICYFYIAYMMIWLLKTSYTKLSQIAISERLARLIQQMGKYSYEIYLFQIFYYSIISIYVSKATAAIEIHLLERVLYIIISTILCTLPVIIYKQFTKSESK